MDQEIKKGLKLIIILSTAVLILLIIYMFFAHTMPVITKIMAMLPVIFLPFLIAIIIALFIEPLVELIEDRLHLKRSTAVIFSLTAVISIASSLIAILISIVIREMSEIYYLAVNNSDAIVNKLMDFVSDFRLFYLQLDLPPRVTNSIQNSLESYLAIFTQTIEKSINILVKLVSILPGMFILLIIATVASFFIIRDRAYIREFFLGLLPPDMREKLQKLVGELFHALIGFIKAYSILISITALVTMVAMRILNVPYVFTIALLVGLLDILPILGPGAVFIPWIIFEFINGNIGMGISILIVYTIISVIRQFLEPKIVGDNIGLHPLATLVSLYAGLQIAGVKGMIMGPVLVIFIMSLYRAGIIKKRNWREEE